MEKNRIAEIMNAVGSDKSSVHHYETGYAELLDRPVSNLLEIGISNSVKEKSSIWGWSQLFPDALIYGIDIVPGKMINTGKISTFLADQSDPVELEKIINLLGETKMDVIIDDGSHWFEDSSVSFNLFYDKLLAPGGVYIIEDIQKIEATRHSIMPNQQTLGDWTKFLNQKVLGGLAFKTFDCLPGKDDDSLLIAVEKSL